MCNNYKVMKLLVKKRSTGYRKFFAASNNHQGFDMIGLIGTLLTVNFKKVQAIQPCISNQEEQMRYSLFVFIWVI